MKAGPLLEVGNEGWAALEVGDEAGGQDLQPAPEDSAAGWGRVQEKQTTGVQSRQLEIWLCISEDD